jgi:GT2 family glycosyltransferase
MKKVSIVVLNWNGEEYIADCLKSLENQSYKNYEITVVDNDSSDESIKIIKKFKKVKLIEHNENSGNAEGINIGIRNSNGDYIINLDNDTKVNKDFITELVKVADKHKDCGMLASKMVFYDQPDLINSTGLDFYDDGSAVDRNIREKDKGFEEIEEVFAPCGGSALYKREALEGIKKLEGDYFDQDFKFYYEDADVAFRIRHLGYKCFYVPKAVTYHKVNASTKKVKDLRVYYGVRNKIFFLIKNYPIKVLIKSLPKILIKQILSTIYYLFQGKLVVLKARWDAIVGLRNMLKKRKKIDPSNSKLNFPFKKNSLFNLFFN